MAAKARVVIDVNVVVSAFLFPESTPGRLVLSSRRRLVPVISAPLLAELVEVMERPKFDRYVSRNLRLQFLAAYVSRCERVEVARQLAVCRDPKDNHILETAIAGQADAIISGDSDLLELGVFEGIPIVSPADYEL